MEENHGFWKRCTALAVGRAAADHHPVSLVLASLGSLVDEHRHNHIDHSDYRPLGRFQRPRWRAVLRDRLLRRWWARSRHHYSDHSLVVGTNLNANQRTT